MNVSTSKLDAETDLGLTCGTCGASMGVTAARCTNCGAVNTKDFGGLLLDRGVPWWIFLPTAIVSLPWGLFGVAFYRLSTPSLYRRLGWLFWLGCPIVGTYLWWHARRCENIADASRVVHSKLDSSARVKLKMELLGRLGHKSSHAIDDLLEAARFFDEIGAAEKDGTLVVNLRSAARGLQKFDRDTFWGQIQAACDQFKVAFPDDQLELFDRVVDRLDRREAAGTAGPMLLERKDLVSLVLKRKRGLLQHPPYLADGEPIVFQWMVALLACAGLIDFVT